jgi:hypothetical protein
LIRGFDHVVLVVLAWPQPSPIPCVAYELRERGGT